MRPRKCEYNMCKGQRNLSLCHFCRSRHERLGSILKHAIVTVLDSIDGVVRCVIPYFGRRRYHLGWIVRLKSCGRCNAREVWINRVVRPKAWWEKMVTRHAA